MKHDRSDFLLPVYASTAQASTSASIHNAFRLSLELASINLL